MSKYQYDVIIIGGGSGGLVAARVMATLGARVALLDKERLGGDCLHYGCVPSKSLLYAAKLVKAAQEASLLISDNTPTKLNVDMAKVAQRIQGIIERIGEAEKSFVEQVEVKFGQAEFVSKHELKLNDQILTAHTFVIATGSHPKIPDLKGLKDVGFLTNENVFNLTQLPPSLIIVGGGPVAVELAQAFCRLGSKVTLLQRANHLLPKEEPEVSDLIRQVLQSEGVKVFLNVNITGVTKNNTGKKVVEAQHDGITIQFEADEVIIAVGREPNTTELKLEAAGVTYTSQGIAVNDYLQTSTDNIFAIGDVIGGYLFTHTAAYQAGIVAQNALLPIKAVRKKTDYRVVPWVTFCDPEAARVGLTENEARQKYGKIKVIRFDWHAIDRAQTDDQTVGFIKLILDAQHNQIYGAHLVGHNAGEMLAQISLAMQHKLGIKGILATVHAYPTIATGLQSAAFEAYLTSPTINIARQILRPILALRG